MRSQTCPVCGKDTSQQTFGPVLCPPCYQKRRRQGLSTRVAKDQVTSIELARRYNGNPPVLICCRCGKPKPGWFKGDLCSECFLAGDETMVQRIYVLIDPRDEVIHYCGVTQQLLETRLSMHISSATAGKDTPVYQWIRTLRKEGVQPAIRLVEETDDRTREQYWIAYFRERGFELHNMDDGGGFGRDITEETRQKQAKAHTGKPLSAEHRAAQAAGHREATSEQRSADHSETGEKLYRGFNRKPLSNDQLAGFRALARQVEADDNALHQLSESQE